MTDLRHARERCLVNESGFHRYNVSEYNNVCIDCGAMQEWVVPVTVDYEAAETYIHEHQSTTKIFTETEYRQAVEKQVKGAVDAALGIGGTP